MESLLMYLSYATFNSASNYLTFKKKLKQIEKNIENNNYQTNQFCSKNVEINEDLKVYMDYLKENIKSSNLFNLYNNLKDLKVESNKKIILAGNLGSYNATTNTIKYIKKSCLGHELLHVASTYRKEESNIQVGFSLSLEDGRIGNAINEGYTDYLNEEFFNNHASAYNCVRKIAGYTEELIGKEKMQDLYFNNDLLGLYKELQKYMSKKDAIEFIALQDSLLNACSAKNIYYKKPESQLNKILDDSFKQKALIK